MGLFEHFPYTNFHDLNLDIILARVKKSATDAADAAADAAQAASNVVAALTAANQAIAQATAAQAAAETAANAAQTAADAAEEAAEIAAREAGLEIIDVYGDLDTNSITDVQTDYTWEQLCNKVATGKVFFRIFNTDDSALYIPPAFPARIMRTYPDTWVDANIQIDSFATGFGGEAISGLYIRKAYINQNYGGVYRQIYFSFPS